VHANACKMYVNCTPTQISLHEHMSKSLARTKRRVTNNFHCLNGKTRIYLPNATSPRKKKNPYYFHIHTQDYFSNLNLRTLLATEQKKYCAPKVELKLYVPFRIHPGVISFPYGDIDFFIYASGQKINGPGLVPNGNCVMMRFKPRVGATQTHTKH
jgi:hypothetical protein